MPLETQKPQGQEEQLYTPPGPQPIVFEDFSGGLNTNSTRPGIKENELWWSDGFFPIAPNYLRTIPDVGPPLYDPSVNGPNITPVALNELWVSGSSCDVLGFALATNGTTPPDYDIEGSNTTLTGPLGNTVSLTWSVWLDSADKIFALNSVQTSATPTTWQTSIVVFPKASNGNVPPLYTIVGASTHLDDYQDVSPPTTRFGICLDASDNVYVAMNNLAGGAVLKFAANAQGNAAPTFFIASSVTECYGSVHFDSARNYIWVATTSQSVSLGGTVGIFAYDLSGTNVVSISGALTQLVDPYQVYIGPDGSIFVNDASQAETLVYAPSANGNVAPTRTFASGDVLGANAISGIAVDSTGKEYIGTYRYGSLGLIQVFAAGETSGAATAIQNMTNARLSTLQDGTSSTPFQIFIR